jgi:hypothetical protein
VNKQTQGITAAVITLVLGLSLVGVLKVLKVEESGVLIALLLMPLLAYGIASGRLTELSGPGGWGAKFAQLETEIAKTKLKVEELFLLSMSEAAFSNLCKLHDGWAGEYWLDPSLRSGLAAELNHFKLLGYIQFNNGLNIHGVGNIPTGNQSNLSQYISLTALGKQYVLARRDIQS